MYLRPANTVQRKKSGLAGERIYNIHLGLYKAQLDLGVTLIFENLFVPRKENFKSNETKHKNITLYFHVEWDGINAGWKAWKCFIKRDVMENDKQMYKTTRAVGRKENTIDQKPFNSH